MRSKRSQNPTPVPPTPSHDPIALPASRPRYDATFREDAVRCWLNSGKPAYAIAAELGIKTDRLYAWRSKVPSPAGQRLQKRPAKNDSHSDLRSQLDVTLAELRRITEQRDILKKLWVSSPNTGRVLPTD